MQRVRPYRRIIFSIIFSLLFVLLIFLDQFTKSIFMNLHNNTDWQKTTVINGFFEFRYAVNTGAAWSFLANVSWAQTFFKVLTVISLALFFAYYIFVCKKGYKFLRIALILIISGTIGNFIDRIVFGGVIDFISLIFGTYYFPVFNLADSYMTVGIIMLIIHFLFLDKNKLINIHGKKKDNGK